MSHVVDAELLRRGIAKASDGLVDRESLVELVILGAVAGEHLLVVGPPGTAKSEAVRRATTMLDGRLFEYLLGRFTEPSEIFGPVDLRRLREGVVEVETTGMLPEAEVAFLDEVFLGSTAILNTLLGILNERQFRKGSTILKSPLRICVGASNALPEDPALAAFADRFLLRTFVRSTPDSMLESLLAKGWSLGGAPLVAEQGGMEAVGRLATLLPTVNMDAARPLLSEMYRRLRSSAIHLTDRRMVRSQRLVAAAALLDGRLAADGRDLWPVIFAVPTAEMQAAARELLSASLEHSRNQSLRMAALEAGAGPAARADLLVGAAEALLADSSADPAWKLRAEAWLRDVDAGFTPAKQPAALADVGRKVRERVLAS
jgi:MoxR-like ATPase